MCQGGRLLDRGDEVVLAVGPLPLERRVSSANQSSRSISPPSGVRAVMRSTSAAIVAAWPRMNLSRSAWLWSAFRRSSGSASNTTPSPKIGVMNG
jgi:hypothetical protein